MSAATPNFFDAGSPYLHHPLLTDERTAAELDHLSNLLNLQAETRVLDVGCGAGRHSIELARRGCAVTATDPSPTMVAATTDRAHEAGVAVDVHCTELATLVRDQVRNERPVQNGPFTSALCLFTTLGQVGPNGSNLGLLGDIAKVLTPGGRVAIEVPHRTSVLATFAERTEIPTPVGHTVIDRSFDPTTSVVTEHFTVTANDESSEFLLRFQLFAPEELTELLHASGFEVLSLTNGYTDEPVDETSPMLLAIARLAAP